MHSDYKSLIDLILRHVTDDEIVEQRGLKHANMMLFVLDDSSNILLITLSSGIELGSAT